MRNGYTARYVNTCRVILKSTVCCAVPYSLFTPQRSITLQYGSFHGAKVLAIRDLLPTPIGFISFLDANKTVDARVLSVTRTSAVTAQKGPMCSNFTKSNRLMFSLPTCQPANKSDSINHCGVHSHHTHTHTHARTSVSIDTQSQNTQHLSELHKRVGLR
jgi:hypothetical protein